MATNRKNLGVNTGYPEQTSSGLPTGEQCIFRPARKRARVFTANDVARLAKTVSKTTSPLKIAAYVLLALGLGTGLCVASRALERVTSIWSFLGDGAEILAAAAVVEVLLNQLGRIKIPLVNRLAIAIIVLLGLVHKVITALSDIVSDIETLRSLIDMVDGICTEIKAAPDRVVNLID
jgi:hypothetical protein